MTSREIRAVREAYGLPRDDFGRAFAVTGQTIYTWEHGLRLPGPLTKALLLRLAEVARAPAARRRMRNVLLQAAHMFPLPTPGKRVADSGLGLLLTALFRGKM